MSCNEAVAYVCGLINSESSPSTCSAMSDTFDSILYLCAEKSHAETFTQFKKCLEKNEWFEQNYQNMFIWSSVYSDSLAVYQVLKY